MIINAVTVLDTAKMDSQTKMEIGCIQIELQQKFSENFWNQDQLMERFSMVVSKIFGSAKEGLKMADLGFQTSKTPKEIVGFLKDNGFEYLKNEMTEIVSWNKASEDTVAGKLLRYTTPCRVERIRRVWVEKYQYEKATKVKVGKVSVRLYEVPDMGVIAGLINSGFTVEIVGKKGIRLSKVA